MNIEIVRSGPLGSQETLSTGTFILNVLLLKKIPDTFCEQIEIWFIDLDVKSLEF